jgi:hypothetical protein
MIQINLLPDVKMELLKARKMRTMVTSISIIVAIVAGGVVTLLAMYVFGAQALVEHNTSAAITTEYDKLSKVEDLSKTLTIQNQLSEISSQHENKVYSARLFDLLTTTAPEGKNAIAISRLSLSIEENLITIEASAKNGYEALEVFRKTLEKTEFQFNEGGDEQKSVPIANSIQLGESNRGEDEDGNPTLSLTLSFEYPTELFSASSKQGKIVTPDKQNVTDSNLGVPKSLFGKGSK